MQSAQPTPVDVFLRTHPDRGGLRVQVTCGGGRFPVAGAQVVISRAFGTEEHIFYRGVTDGSGILSGIRLPAPPFAWSQASDTAALSGLDYQVSVQHPMFQPVAGPDGDGIRRSGDHPAGDAGASGVRKERA